MDFCRHFVYIISLQLCYSSMPFPLIHVVFHIKYEYLSKNVPSLSHFHRVIHIFSRFPHLIINKRYVYIILSTVSFSLYIILYQTCKQTVRMPENADLARFIRIYGAPWHFSKLNICVKIYLS